MKKSFILIFMLYFVSQLNAQDYKTQVENNNRFTFELFSKVNSGNKNVFLSPFSISAALAMTYEGARGKTRKEMGEVLHFPDDNLRVNKSFGSLITEIQKSNNPKFYTLSLANSVWAQEGYRFLHSFFTTIEKYYYAKINEADFENNIKREEARQKINRWVASKTNNKIKELLDKKALDKDTKMVLVNAVYFLAQWEKTFDKNATKKDDFFTLSGKTKKDFMHTGGRMKFAEYNNVSMLEIPYKDKKASMIILLPDTSLDFSLFKKSLTYGYFSNIYKKAVYRSVSLSLPKFKTEYKNDMAKILYTAGIKRAFSNRADFTGMTCKKELKIDKVIHQTFINIDETGTEAAAATAVIMRKITSVNPADKVIFNANHPFVYLIKENKTGSILFIGQLVK